MSNLMYGKGRDKFLMGDLDWINNRIMVSLISLSLYTLQIDVDEFLSDVPDAAIIASELLAGKVSNGLGTADADDINFLAVTSVFQIDAVIIWYDTRIKQTSPLIVYYDDAPTLPIIPTNDDIAISWPDDANKIFTL